MTRAAAILVVAASLLALGAVTGCDRTRPYVPPGAESAEVTDAVKGSPAQPVTTAAGVQAQPPTMTPRGWRFSYADPSASSVHLAGDFNEWSTSANALEKGEGGVWYVVIPLDGGTYQYKFVINGTDWKTDPTNPETADDGYGGENSVVTVP
jgi:1,4-alpha-glucan branching enzyme